MTMRYVVAVGIADIRRDPAADAERVTQALMNVPAQASATTDEWTHVALPDYEGWIHTTELAEPISKGFTKIGEHCATPLDLVAVVTATHTQLYTDAEGSATVGTVYLSTLLPLLDTMMPVRLQVALLGEITAWVDRSAVSIRRSDQPFPLASITTITGYARALLDVPYLWGGTSWAGIDCSGLVQLCYRMGGYLLPRDADQQCAALSQSVSREQMQEGDLIFFGSTRITHVAMAVNKQEYIHAEGQHYNRVLLNSFDPASPYYYQRLSEIVVAVKRVVP